MMVNLFSIFDPSTSMCLSLNWLSMMIMLLINPMSLWLLPSRLHMSFNLLMMFIFNEFNLIVNNKFNTNLLIFIMLMLSIMTMNLMGLMPYIFTPTSHLVVNLTMSLILWVSFMMYGWLVNTNHMLIHMVPMNTPTMLMSFMVLIESISNLIRPWTLTIRLSANMLAGHLMMTLMGSSMNKFLLFLPLMIMMQNMLIILEMSVSLIQAYVLSILSTLYFNESNNYDNN